MSSQTSRFWSCVEGLQKKYSFIPYIYALIGNIAMVFMHLNMKIVSTHLPPLNGLFIRSFFLFLLNSAVIWSSGQKIDQKDPAIFKILAKRSVSSTLALSCFLGSVPYAPIAVINSLFNIAPIIIFFIQAYSYKKAINFIHLSLTLLCFVGVLLIIKPDFIFGSSNQDWPLIFLILPIVAAFFQAYASFLINELKGKASTKLTLQYFYLVQALFTGMLQNFQTQEFPPASQIPVSLYFSMLALVLCGYAFQNFITRAILLKQASYIVPFQYFAVIFASILDMTLYGVHFDFISFLGMILTSVGLLSKLVAKE